MKKIIISVMIVFAIVIGMITGSFIHENNKKKEIHNAALTQAICQLWEDYFNGEDLEGIVGYEIEVNYTDGKTYIENIYFEEIAELVSAYEEEA